MREAPPYASGSSTQASGHGSSLRSRQHADQHRPAGPGHQIRGFRRSDRLASRSAVPGTGSTHSSSRRIELVYANVWAATYRICRAPERLNRRLARRSCPLAACGAGSPQRRISSARSPTRRMSKRTQPRSWAQRSWSRASSAPAPPASDRDASWSRAAAEPNAAAILAATARPSRSATRKLRSAERPSTSHGCRAGR